MEIVISKIDGSGSSTIYYKDDGKRGVEVWLGQRGGQAVAKVELIDLDIDIYGGEAFRKEVDTIFGKRKGDKFAKINVTGEKDKRTAKFRKLALRHFGIAISKKPSLIVNIMNENYQDGQSAGRREIQNGFMELMNR